MITMKLNLLHFFMGTLAGKVIIDASVFIVGFILLQHWVLPSLPQDIGTWDYDFIEEVDASSAEFQAQRDYVERLAAKQRHQYNRSVVIKKMYRVYPAQPDTDDGMSTDDEALTQSQVPLVLQDADPGGINTFRLFHGTNYIAGEAIVNGGFKLPFHGGMFGKGIYFADCPQKSLQYSNHIIGRGKLLLLCRVELGQPKFMKTADNLEEGFRTDHASNWFVPAMSGILRPSNAYDSVVAVTRNHGGAVRVPEYIIYNPRQATVEYILEVEETRGQ